MMSLLMIGMNVGMISTARVKPTINILNILLGVVTKVGQGLTFGYMSEVQLVYDDTPIAIGNNSNKKMNNQLGGKRSRKNKSKSLKKSKQMKQTRKK